MLEIASQITICLLIAALLGFIIGYIVAKSNTAKTEIAEEKKAETEEKSDIETEKKVKVDEEAKKLAEAKTKADKKAKKATLEAEKKAEAEAAEKVKADEEANAKGEKPEILSAPLNEAKDDLTQIKGIGPKVEDQLNEAGIYHFNQIASWTEANIKWLEINTTFAHRATKDLWVSQAKSFK